MSLVCQHNQTGFCKYRQQCKKEHVNEICPNIEICNDATCILRHPKTCKAFEDLCKCKFVNCAYRHINNRTNTKIEGLENAVLELRLEIVKLGNNIIEDCSQKIGFLDRDIKALRYDINQLSKNIKSTELLLNKLNEKETWESPDINKKPVTMKITTARKETMKNIIDANSGESQKHDFQCHQCDFVCLKNETLMKHINTKHGDQIETKVSKSKCSICDDKFVTKAEYQKHKEEHIEEIEGLDISTLTNGHNLFECNLCSFESGYGDSIREHLVDHLNHSNENLIEAAEYEKKSFLDEYDDYGNYIGDDPNLMDSDDKSETDDEN